MDPVRVPGASGALAAAARRAPEGVRGGAELRLRLLRREGQAGGGWAEPAARPGGRAGSTGPEPIRSRTVRAFAAAYAGDRPACGGALPVVRPWRRRRCFVASDGPQAAAGTEVAWRARPRWPRGRIVPAAADADEASAHHARRLRGAVRAGGADRRTGGRYGRCRTVRWGEILVRGPNVGIGYWKGALEQSAEVFGAVLARSRRAAVAAHRRPRRACTTDGCWSTGAV